MRWLPAGSFDAISNRRRRSTIGTTMPRRFITPSTKAGALGRRAICSGGRAISSTDAIGSPVFLIAEPEDDELLVSHGVSIRFGPRHRRLRRYARTAPGAPDRTGTDDPAKARPPGACRDRGGKSR